MQFNLIKSEMFSQYLVYVKGSRFLNYVVSLYEPVLEPVEDLQK